MSEVYSADCSWYFSFVVHALNALAEARREFPFYKGLELRYDGRKFKMAGTIYSPSLGLGCRTFFEKAELFELFLEKNQFHLSYSLVRLFVNAR